MQAGFSLILLEGPCSFCRDRVCNNSGHGSFSLDFSILSLSLCLSMCVCACAHMHIELQAEIMYCSQFCHLSLLFDFFSILFFYFCKSFKIEPLTGLELTSGRLGYACQRFLSTKRTGKLPLALPLKNMGAGIELGSYCFTDGAVSPDPSLLLLSWYSK